MSDSVLTQQLNGKNRSAKTKEEDRPNVMTNVAMLHFSKGLIKFPLETFPQL